MCFHKKKGLEVLKLAESIWQENARKCWQELIFVMREAAGGDASHRTLTLLGRGAATRVSRCARPHVVGGRVNGEYSTDDTVILLTGWRTSDFMYESQPRRSVHLPPDLRF